MALVRCDECQQTVSDKAATCPHCGAPQHSSISQLPPPLPAARELLRPAAKKRSPVRTAASVVAGLVLFLVLLVVLKVSENKTATPNAVISENQKAAAEQAQVIELLKKQEEEAKKQAEEARCKTEIKCLAEKKSIEASIRCAPYVEKIAKNNFEWIDKWYEPKFSHFRWKDQKNLVVTYIGDKIKYQNGFGAWVLSRYECDYSTVSGSVLDVRASAGRLE